MTRSAKSKNAALIAALSFALVTGSAHGESNKCAHVSVRSLPPTPEADSTAASTQLARGSSAASLGELLRDWDRAGFNAPSKPAQPRVHGRNGTVTIGEYNSMVALIRSAIRDSACGRDQEALNKIAKVRALLPADPKQSSQ